MIAVIPAKIGVDSCKNNGTDTDEIVKNVPFVKLIILSFKVYSSICKITNKNLIVV